PTTSSTAATSFFPASRRMPGQSSAWLVGMAGTLSRRVTRPPEMMDCNRTLCVAGCFNGVSMFWSGVHGQRVAREGCAELVLTIRHLEHRRGVSCRGAHVGHVQRDHGPVGEVADDSPDPRGAVHASRDQ